MPSAKRSSRRLWRFALWLPTLGLGVPVLFLLVFSVAPLPCSAFMLGYQIERATSERQLPPLRHDWVGWDRISDAAKLAVIAAEDQRFAEHDGFDWAAIQAAMRYNRAGGSLRGASTISQQTAKNLFLWPGRSWLRKGLELYCTLLLETVWSKRRILTVYLNVAEFGPGVYGVQAAARQMFDKDAARLDAREAALLAAVLPFPRRYSAAQPSAYVRRRAAWIEAQMRQLGAATLKRLE